MLEPCRIAAWITESFDSWAWSDIIKDSEGVDYIGECANLRGRIAALEQAALEAAAQAVASQIARDEGTPFKPYANDQDRDIARAAISAYLKACAEDKEVMAAVGESC